MKKVWSIVGILTVLIVCAATGHAQMLWNGRGHVPEEYRVDWSHAGLLPETPTVGDHLLDVTQQEGAGFDEKVRNTISRATEVTQNGTNDQTVIVYFPSGVYRLTRPVILGPEHSNIIFQGAGSHRTVLEARFGSAYGNVFDFRGRAGSVCQVDQDIPKGTATIVSADLPSAFFPGDWILFCEDRFPYADPGNVGQVTQLLTVEGTTGIMKDEANMSYLANREDPRRDFGRRGYQSPQNEMPPLWVAKVTPVMNVGIEHLTVRRLDGGKPAKDDYGDGLNVQMNYAVNCWIKGVELSNAARYSPSRRVRRSQTIAVFGRMVKLPSRISIFSGRGMTLAGLRSAPMATSGPAASRNAASRIRALIRYCLRFSVNDLRDPFGCFVFRGGARADSLDLGAAILRTPSCGCDRIR